MTLSSATAAGATPAPALPRLRAQPGTPFTRGGKLYTVMAVHAAETGDLRLLCAIEPRPRAG